MIDLGRCKKALRGLYGQETREVPQRVKTQVRRRAKGKCEYPRCRKKGSEFHHWSRAEGTINTTALLCHDHHRNKKYGTHTYRSYNDPVVGSIPQLVSRKRIRILRTTKKKRA